MTNEEAIKSLKKLKSFHNGSYGTAIDLAIMALEQQSVTDFADKCQECGKIQNELLKNKWIPVSERLPLCEQEVLICTQSRFISGKTKSIITSAIYEDGNMRECYSRWHWEDIEYESWDEEEDCGIIPEGWWEYRHYNPDEVYNNLVDDFILAWMPLPKPYEEVQDE